MSIGRIIRTVARRGAAAFAFSIVPLPVARARPPLLPATRDTAFDLAVQEVDVRQTGPTPMFREVSVRCGVQNRGPSVSRGSEVLVISRPRHDGPKIL